MSYSSPVWHPHSPLFTRRAPSSLQRWLTDRRSLTALLTHASDNAFSVKVLSEGWQAALPGEADDQLAFVRHVVLNCHNMATVFARTVIPRSSLTGELNALTRLGNRPLGAVLFSNPRVKRQNLEIAAIHPGTRLHRLAGPFSPQPDSTLWGRRSVFTLGSASLLVNEIFLHDMHRLKLKPV